MDGNALATRDVADDFFAANGIATSRTVNQKVVLSLNLQRVRTGEVQLAHRFGHDRFPHCRAWFRELLRASPWVAKPGASLFST
jgi:hypothetical protein